MRYFVDDDNRLYQIQRCPFCGVDHAKIISQAELWEEDTASCAERYTVVCDRDDGGCGATCGFHESKQKAVCRWNTRVVI